MDKFYKVGFVNDLKKLLHLGMIFNNVVDYSVFIIVDES